MSEANARFIIDRLLREADWILPDDGSGDGGGGRAANVQAEVPNKNGKADYALTDSNGYFLAVIEAKNEIVHPLIGKEQARSYAEALNCRFVILSNGITHYLWDLAQGNPQPTHAFPSQKTLELIKDKFNPPRQATTEIGADYIAKTQLSDFDKNPDYLDESKRETFVAKHKLRFLRPYQIKAIQAIQAAIARGDNRFLLEMATGTGKTLTSSALIKMFRQHHKVHRTLFLVDRIELEEQARKAFDETLKNDCTTVIWKANRSDWQRADIVVSTVQSFIHRNKYRKVFQPADFDLVISDEAHRSLGRRSRKVFEYFIGFKLGLTATPKDYLKAIDTDTIAMNDPRQFEKRLMLDTYTTFGCPSGEPTFRYALEDGVKDGHLINPKVIDARSKITTALLSDEGYVFHGSDEDGNDVEEVFKKKHFEKSFFSENTNRIFCETFMKHALADPYTGEIGKTLIFCVSQNHATRITHILNLLAHQIFPGKYTSDFAVQVTSQVEDAQQMTVAFRNNDLGGQSKIASEYYRTCRGRVCVTVGMMTTGYDCTDILNIAMMRPVYSASEFIQMKGRGTRIHDFSGGWMDKAVMPLGVEAAKKEFLLFDFFGNYEFFENEFKYHEKLELPKKPKYPIDPPVHPIETGTGAGIGAGIVISHHPDILQELREHTIPDEGMRVDTYHSFRDKIAVNKTIAELVRRSAFDEAADYLRRNVFDRPEEYFNLEKLRRALGLDRPLTYEELLLYVFGHLKHIPSHRECLDEEFDRFDKAQQPKDSVYDYAKQVFEAYATDIDGFRDIIDSKRYAELGTHTFGAAFKKLPAELQASIPAYIKQHVNLEKLKHVR